MVLLEDPAVPFDPLFATKVWSRENSISMPVETAEAGSEGKMMA